MAGPFGLAAAVKSKQLRLPLWSLMLATQLLDILFVPLLVLGVESIGVRPGKALGPASYDAALIHADYTHSLVGALNIAISLVSSRAAGGVILPPKYSAPSYSATGFSIYSCTARTCRSCQATRETYHYSASAFGMPRALF